MTWFNSKPISAVFPDTGHPFDTSHLELGLFSCAPWDSNYAEPVTAGSATFGSVLVSGGL